MEETRKIDLGIVKRASADELEIHLTTEGKTLPFRITVGAAAHFAGRIVNALAGLPREAGPPIEECMTEQEKLDALLNAGWEIRDAAARLGVDVKLVSVTGRYLIA